MAKRRGSTGNVLAALASVFIPGLGHLVQGRLLAAVFWFLVVGGLYASGAALFPLLAPAVLLHILCIYGAATFSGS